MSSPQPLTLRGLRRTDDDLLVVVTDEQADLRIYLNEEALEAITPALRSAYLEVRVAPYELDWDEGPLIDEDGETYYPASLRVTL